MPTPAPPPGFQPIQADPAPPPGFVPMSSAPEPFNAIGQAPPSGPEKTPFVGRHYSDNDIKSGILDGGRRGASRKDGTSTGEEADRLTAGQGAPPGVYAYDANSIGEPGITSRKNMYIVQGPKAILDIGTSDLWNQALDSAKQDATIQDTNPKLAEHSAINSAEHAVQAAGYDGYRNTKSHHPGIVFLFGDHPVEGSSSYPKKSPLTAPDQEGTSKG